MNQISQHLRYTAYAPPWLLANTISVLIVFKTLLAMMIDIRAHMSYFFHIFEMVNYTFSSHSLRFKHTT